MGNLAEILGFVNLAAVGFLFFFMKTHLSNRIGAHGKEHGGVDARLERLDDIVRIQKEIKNGQAEVELAVKRTLDSESHRREKRAAFLERQLSQFYWPLLFLLRRNQIVWRQVMNRGNTPDTLSRELHFKLSREFFYPNNEKMMKIIEEKYFLAQPSIELNEEIDRFLAHQSVFQGIRQSLGEEDVDPVRFGVPWPQGFLPAIETETEALQMEYDRLLAQSDA